MNNDTKNIPDVLDILGAIEAPQNLTQSLEKVDFIEDKPSEEIVIESIFQQSVIEEETKANIQKTTPNNNTEENQTVKVQESSQIKKDSSSGNKQEFSRLISASIFGAKYIVTSVFIFSVLLLTTNYSAYTNIAKSYIFEDEIVLERQSLLNGVNASYIEKEVIEENQEEEIVIKKTKQDRVEQLKKQEEETEQIQNQFSIKKLVDKLDKEDINLDISIVPYENRIIIPKIGKNIPLIDIKETIVEGKEQLDNIFMKELEDGIVRYPGSAIPGERGNSFIFGHSSNFPWIAGDYNDIFSRLGQVEVGDIVYSYYNQKKYKYKIKEKKVISPTDVSILKRDKNKSELTLMTCWPIGTTLNRLILIGEIIED